MVETINIEVLKYNKAELTRTVNTQFTQFGVTASADQPPVADTITIPEFFSAYQNLFYTIPKYGETNSHEYLVKTSGDYVGGEAVNEVGDIGGNAFDVGDGVAAVHGLVVELLFGGNFGQQVHANFLFQFSDVVRLNHFLQRVRHVGRERHGNNPPQVAHVGILLDRRNELLGQLGGHDRFHGVGDDDGRKSDYRPHRIVFQKSKNRGHKVIRHPFQMFNDPR